MGGVSSKFGKLKYLKSYLPSEKPTRRKKKRCLTPVGLEPTTFGTDHRCSTDRATIFRPDGSWSGLIIVKISGK